VPRAALSAALATKNATHLLKTTQKYCACHFVKHVGMSRSAMSATRNEVTQRLKPPKVTTFAALTRGTAIAQSSQTVADGCEHESSGELNPQTPKVKREPFATHCGKTFITGKSGKLQE